jgi:hypothetical protein
MSGINPAFKRRPPGVWLVCAVFSIPVGMAIWNIAINAYAGALGMIVFDPDAFWVLCKLFILIVIVGGGVISLFWLKKAALLFFLGAVVSELALTTFHLFSSESLAVLGDRTDVMMGLSVIAIQIGCCFYIMHLRRIGTLN